MDTSIRRSWENNLRSYKVRKDTKIEKEGFDQMFDPASITFKCRQQQHKNNKSSILKQILDPRIDQTDQRDTIDSEIQTKQEKPRQLQFLLVPK